MYEGMAQKPKFSNAAELFFSSTKLQQEAPQDPQGGFSIPKGYKLTKESKSVRMALLVRPATKDAIKKAADLQGLSMNDLINQVLEEYLERQGIE